MEQEPAKLPQLDRLESLVNLVLEQTGRLFQEGSKGGNNSIIAHGTKLKQILPRATAGFHDALDELETELATARAVMRRDYAVFKSQKANLSNGIHIDKPPSATSTEAKLESVDMVMTDAADDKPEVSPAKIQDPIPADTTTKQPEPDAPTKPDAPSKQTSPLQIDTSALKPNTDQPTEPEPNTGAYSTMDFDSLFNDSASASGGSGSINNSPVKEAIATTDKTDGKIITDTKDDAPDFSFETFNEQHLSSGDAQGDNDDITSLLPGLESYANADDDGGNQDDFQMLNFDPTTSNDHSAQATMTTSDPQKPSTQDMTTTSTVNDAQVAEPIDPNRDTTFDDLMDFGDFDMSGLDAGDGNFDDGDNKFDESFFDLE